MIDAESLSEAKHDWDNQTCAYEVPYWMRHMYDDALMIIAQKEAEVKRCHEIINASSTLKHISMMIEEVKRLQKENKILAKYMDIVQKYDDALLADGDYPALARWSELYE